LSIKHLTELAAHNCQGRIIEGNVPILIVLHGVNILCSLSSCR